MSDYTPIRKRKKNTCFKIRVKYFDTHLSLQSQFQALHYFYFLLDIPNLSQYFCVPKSGNCSQTACITPYQSADGEFFLKKRQKV